MGFSKVAYDTGMTKAMAAEMGVPWGTLSRRRTGKSLSKCLQILGGLISTPGRAVRLATHEQVNSRCHRAGRKDSYMDEWYVFFSSTRELNYFVRMLRESIDQLGIKGIIYNKADNTFVYIVKQLMEEE